MSTDSKVVRCGTHGEVGAAFVCVHLAKEKVTPLGFFEPGYDPDNPEPQAWCQGCEDALGATGGWTKELEQQAMISLVCEFCFETIRGIHAKAA